MSRRGEWKRGKTIRAAAFHDVYHAGRIQLLKRLQGAASR